MNSSRRVEEHERGRESETEVFAKRKERWWRMGGACETTWRVSQQFLSSVHECEGGLP